MINIGFQIERRVELRALGPSRTAAIIANAGNRSLEESQRAQRDLVARRFIDRQRRGFLSRMIKISRDDRLRPDRLMGRVRVAGPEGAEDRKNLLLKHEDGGVRRPGGGYSIDPSARVRGVFWIPTQEIRPQFSDIVPRRLYPAALHLVESRYEGTTRKGGRAGAARVHRTSTGKLQLKGDKRTFVLFGANDGRPIGVFQRSGRSKWGGRGRSGGRAIRWDNRTSSARLRDDIRLIWAFRPTITLRPRLEFFSTVERVLHERMPINLEGFLAKALQQAPRGR